MTWDTREPRKHAKPTSPAPKGWDGPGWWGEANQQPPKPAPSVRSAAAPSVRAATPAAGSRAVNGSAANPSNGSAGKSDAILAARRAAPPRSRSRSRSSNGFSNGFSFGSIRLVAGFALGMLGALFLAAVGVLALSQSYDGKILPGVHAGIVDVSGLTRDEAVAKIDTAYAPLSQGQVTVTTPAGTQTITYAQAGRAPDSAAMADAALAIGHGGDAISTAASTLKTFAGGAMVPVMIKLDPMSVARALHDMTASSLEPAKDATVVTSGTDFSVSPSAPGRGIDEAAIQSTIIVPNRSTWPR